MASGSSFSFLTLDLLRNMAENLLFRNAAKAFPESGKGFSMPELRTASSSLVPENFFFSDFSRQDPTAATNSCSELWVVVPFSHTRGSVVDSHPGGRGGTGDSVSYFGMDFVVGCKTYDH